MKYLTAFVFASVLSVLSYASVSPNLKAHWFDEGSEASTIRQVCADPSVVSMDFSSLHLDEGTLFDHIVKGLADREQITEKSGTLTGLKFMDLSSDEITEGGLLRFLKALQEGVSVSGGSAKIYPDVRGTVVKIQVDITEEFLEQCRKIAPSAMAGGLRLVD